VSPGTDDHVTNRAGHEQQSEAIADEPGHADHDAADKDENSVEQLRRWHLAPSEARSRLRQDAKPDTTDDEWAEGAHSDQEDQRRKESDRPTDRNEGHKLGRERKEHTKKEHGATYPLDRQTSGPSPPSHTRAVNLRSVGRGVVQFAKSERNDAVRVGPAGVGVLLTEEVRMNLPTIIPTDARAAQEELVDLRSLAVHADHVRWTTRGPHAGAFSSVVRRFATEWAAWSERLADYLVGHHTTPDGRVSTLTHGRYRGWLPCTWRDAVEAETWLLHEIEVLRSWTHTRAEETEDRAALGALLTDIEAGLDRQLHACEAWTSDHNGTPSGRMADGPSRGRRFHPPFWSAAAAWAAGRKHTSPHDGHRRRTDPRRARGS
jgi:hypothetical protein